jgi:hypothetical protein
MATPNAKAQGQAKSVAFGLPHWSAMSGDKAMSRGRAESSVDGNRLEAWGRRRKTVQALALCVRIILECAAGIEHKVDPMSLAR